MKPATLSSSTAFSAASFARSFPLKKIRVSRSASARRRLISWRPLLSTDVLSVQVLCIVVGDDVMNKVRASV